MKYRMMWLKFVQVDQVVPTTLAPFPTLFSWPEKHVLHNLIVQSIKQNDSRSKIRLEQHLVILLPKLLAAQVELILHLELVQEKFTKPVLPLSQQVHPSSNVELQKNLDSWHSHTAHGFAVRG